MKSPNKPLYSLALWENTYLLLKQWKTSISSQYAKETITANPSYPSLLSVIDFLEIGNMSYEAVEADASYIQEFNYPLLAHIRHPGQEFLHLVKDISGWEKNKEITQYWSGVVVYPEKGAKWQHEENTKYKTNEIKNRLVASAFVILGLLLLIFSYFKRPDFVFNAIGSLTLMGLIISTFALGTELGFQNEIVKQVCGTISSGGCEDVLKSKYAKGIAGVSPADASILYFATQFVYYLIGGFYPVLFQGKLLFAIAGIGVAIWSIYTQGAKVKKWCALCLAIVAIIVTQSILLVKMVPQPLNYFGLSIFASLFLFFLLILLPLKKLVVQLNNNKLLLTEFKSWKMDTKIFSSLWAQEQIVNTTILPHDIFLGNPDSTIHITVACSLYCRPCSNAHKVIDDLLYRYNNKIRIQFRFLSNPKDNKDIRTIALRAIFQRASATTNNFEFQQMLTDWFEWINFEKWCDKWKPDKNTDVNREIVQHAKWIEESQIKYTPTIFVNGRRLPGRYNLKDLDMLIPDLTTHQIGEPQKTLLAY